MNPTQNILDRLENVTETNGSWSARCPCHDDKRNSLCVNESDSGCCLIKCQAGCETPNVLQAIGLAMKDLFGGSDNLHQNSGEGSKPHIVAEYDYRDEKGELLFQVVRFEPKDFRQRKPDGNGGWLWKLGDVRRVPYRLPELLKSNDPHSVFIPEGEKDCNRLAEMNLISTCGAGGAGKWKSSHNEFLKDRKVVILPDNDNPGREHAAQVAASLDGVASSIKVIELPNLPDKGDVSDWLNAGGTKEQLRKLVESATEWKPDFVEPGSEQQKVEVPAGKPLPSLVTLQSSATAYLEKVKAGKQQLVSLGVPSLDAAIGGGCEEGELVLAAARPGHCKSAFGLQVVSSATSAGLPSLIVSEEMSAISLGKRAILFSSCVAEENWLYRFEEVETELSKHFSNRSPCFISESVGTIERASQVIRRAVEEHGIKLCVIDYCQLLKSEGGNRYEQVTNTSIELRRLASELKITLIVLAQLNRQVELREKFIPRMGDLKDSGQLEQDCDVLLFLLWPHRIDRNEDPNKFMFFVGKNRNRAINQSVVECKFYPSRQMITDDAKTLSEISDIDVNGLFDDPFRKVDMKNKSKEISVEEFRKIFGLDSEQCDENRTEEPVDAHTENATDPQPNSDFAELINGYSDEELTEEINRLSDPTYGILDDAMENQTHNPNPKQKDPPNDLTP